MGGNLLVSDSLFLLLFIKFIIQLNLLDSNITLQSTLKPALLKRNHKLTLLQAFFEIFGDEIWNILQVKTMN